METKKAKINYRNFFHVYGVILICISFILIIKLLIPKSPSFQVVLLGSLIGLILGLIISNRKYLLTLEINDSNIIINYFRFYLIPKNIQYSIDQIDKVICKSGIFSRNEIVITLKNDKKKYTFDIPNKKMIEFLSMKMEFENLINIIEK
jgi:hypothetical protein